MCYKSKAMPYIASIKVVMSDLSFFSFGNDNKIKIFKIAYFEIENSFIV